MFIENWLIKESLIPKLSKKKEEKNINEENSEIYEDNKKKYENLLIENEDKNKNLLLGNEEKSIKNEDLIKKIEVKKKDEV